MISRSRCALSSLRSDCIILMKSTFRTLSFDLKNTFRHNGIAAEKRDFRPGAGVPAVYPNQLGPSHYESFGISSKLEKCFF